MSADDEEAAPEAPAAAETAEATKTAEEKAAAAANLAPARCHVCRAPVERRVPADAPGASGVRHTCELCHELLRAPRCRGCGEPVRDAKKGDPEPYHEQCRRCTSCNQVIGSKDAQKIAGRLVCLSCAGLFGHFFAPDRRTQQEMMKETFRAWDEDGNGVVEKSEIRRVLKALDPDFADHDLDRLMYEIDQNSDAVVDFSEFCDWIMKPDPLACLKQDDCFEQFVAGLMREAGEASQHYKQEIAEIHVRPDGIFFVLRNGTYNQESVAVWNDDVQVVLLNPEEFIFKVECNDHGLVVTMNTGRIATVPVCGAGFEPSNSPEGFHIVGLRTKPDDSVAKVGERVVGVDIAPLASARSYDAGSAMRFAAEREFLSLLRELLAKAEIDVNGFSEGGVTALMLAAQYGSVGAMRMLLTCKANPNLADQDGWTALTFASRCGQTTAMHILLAKEASQEGDGGVALREAIRQEHNSAARALLRAGFGAAPTGTFAIEKATDKECRLPRPKITPGGGAFSSPVTVRITFEEENPTDAGSQVCIYYTLDGRDPVVSGRRYRKPFVLKQKRTNLRAVAMRGKERSLTADTVFVICHYVMPDEVVSGALRLRTFPEAKAVVRRAIAGCVHVPVERVTVQDPLPQPISKLVWVRIPVSYPKPKYRIVIHGHTTLVKGSRLQKQFLDKFKKDIEKAVHESPENVTLDKEWLDGGRIAITFTMPTQQGEEVSRQLQDPKSFLETKAALRACFRESELQLVESLGEQLADTELRSKIYENMSKKAQINQVSGWGTKDSGVVAFLVASDQAKKIKKNADSAIRMVLPEAVQEAAVEEVGDLAFDYAVDVISRSLRGAGTVGGESHGGEIVEALNEDEFIQKLKSQFKDMGLPGMEASVMTKANPRELSKLEFRLEWDFPLQRPNDPESGHVRRMLDGICMVYVETSLVEVVDFRQQRSKAEQSQNAKKQHKRSSLLNPGGHLARTLGSCIRHSGDVETDTGAKHLMQMDLAAMPHEVTDVYFVLSAFDSNDLSSFPSEAVEIMDLSMGRKLTEYNLQSAGKTKAVVMCNISRPDGKWIVNGLGIPTDGSVDNYEPIMRTIAELQAGYDDWERRKEWVKLRVLSKLSRVTRDSTGAFARLLWEILELPVPIFQLVVKFL
mmetsp:Transcript_52315/g.124852  ORF Transcript_52315/g.124852 Transcript_52315/m.124852 type:complete len:1143 (-) Transcript_52315:84-3512(-)